MNSCPTLDELFANRNLIATRAHIRSCDSCRDMAEAAASPLPTNADDEACANAELLLAVFSDRDLESADADELAEHLADCSRCTLAAQSLLLATPANPRLEQNAWTAAVSPRTPPMNILKSPWFYVASSAAIGIAVLAVLVFANSDSTDSSPPTADQVESNAKSDPSVSAGRIAERPKSKSAPLVADHAAGAQMSDAQRQLLEQALTEAIIAGSFREAYELCDRRIPNGSETVAKKCMLAACKDGNTSRAKRYRARLKTGVARAQLSNLCSTTYKVDVD